MGGGLQAARRWPRLPQVTCHELCHLLGLGNCRWLRCLMQGALRVDEALRRPLDLCPICLRKLQHLLGSEGKVFLCGIFQHKCLHAMPC